MTDQLSVLVVDDNEDLLETFSMILKRRGFCVDTAENGACAVDKFKMRHFDVTLMDIVMPEMNGVEAFRKIREMCPGAIIILMTAYSEDALIQMAQDEGAHRIIHKPIRIDQLIELIKETASSQPILIVDDDADICQTMTKTLEAQGYQVITAGSGEEAVMITQGKTCQIALVDIKLPCMDGLETFLRLKEINPDILAIMMTGYRNEVKDALQKAQAASAIPCLYKPFDPSEAVNLVSQFGEKLRSTEDKDEG